MNIDYEKLVNWDSTIAAYNNAQQIFATAQKISSEGHYGVATSLMILSREEAQKSLLMAFVSSGFYDLSNLSVKEELDECFRWHRYKIASSWLVNAFVSYLIGIFVEGLQKNNTSPEMIESARKAVMERVDNLRKMAIEGTSLLDDLKKAGLYVGPSRRGIWSNPSEMPQSVFLEIQSTTAFHILIVGIARRILHRDDLPEDWKLASQEFRRIISEKPTDPSILTNLEKTGQLGELLANFWKFLQDNDLIKVYESAHKLPENK